MEGNSKSPPFVCTMSERPQSSFAVKRNGIPDLFRTGDEIDFVVKGSWTLSHFFAAVLLQQQPVRKSKHRSQHNTAMRKAVKKEGNIWFESVQN